LNELRRNWTIEKELDNILHCILTIVSAPIGYGKTTSVKTYLYNRSQFKSAWISLVSSDEIETLFWNKLIQVIEKLNSEIGEKLRLLNFPIDFKQMQILIDLLRKLTKNNETVIVVDDYHLSDNNKNINFLLEQIVQENIPKLHIVLITRTRPKFNLINLVSKGLCCFMGTDTLAFTFDETREYFKFMNYNVKENELLDIYNYTKGWISAIYLIFLGLKRGLSINATSDINQLVEENIFNAFDEQTQEILLHLSIFNAFTLKQASYVLENNYLFKILDKLVKENAFVDFNFHNETYNIHNVFLDYLRKRVEKNSIDITKVCNRAGEWYFNQRDVVAAFDYFYRGGKIEVLLELLNNPDSIEIDYLGYRLQQKIYSIHKTLCVKFPFPFLKIACNFIVTGETKTVMQGIEIVDTMYDYFSKDINVSEKLRNKILGELEVLTILIVFNDENNMAEHAKKACDFLDGDISCVILRHNEFTFGLPHFLYTYYKEPGKLKETVNCIIKEFSPPFFDFCGYGCDQVALAEYSLETCDLKNAEFYGNKAIYKASTKNQTGIIICANFTLMRLNLAEGNFFKAKELFIDTKKQFVENKDKLTAQSYAVYNITFDMMEGYLYGCVYDLSKIPKWLIEGKFENIVFMLQGMAFPCIIYGKLVLLSGNYLKLEILCEDFKVRFNKFHNQLGIIHNTIYEAAAKYNLYGIECGVETLIPALADAQKDLIIMPFAENADYILPILYELKKHNDVSLEWLEVVIDKCEKYSKNLKILHRKTRNVILTKREVQVLNLMEQGLTQREIANMTQREIANTLYISLSTVKRYIESMYKKLDANNKTIAIKKAQELNINFGVKNEY